MSLGALPSVLLCLSCEGPHCSQGDVWVRSEREAPGLGSLGCRGKTVTAHSIANYEVTFLNSWEVGWNIIKVQYIIKVQIS